MSRAERDFSFHRTAVAHGTSAGLRQQLPTTKAESCHRLAGLAPRLPSIRLEPTQKPVAHGPLSDR
jgi:hypothetical protein